MLGEFLALLRARDTREHLELLTAARDSLRRVDSIVSKLRGIVQTSPSKMESVLIADLLESALEMIRDRMRRNNINGPRKS